MPRPPQCVVVLARDDCATHNEVTCIVYISLVVGWVL
jgi:hypothetical protein